MNSQQFSDDDFVYVDPDAKSVVSLVEWDAKGNAVPKEWPRKAKDSQDEKPSKFHKARKRYYPWGSYRTMKKLYKIEGKQKEKDTEEYLQLETAIAKLQEEPYWN